MRAEARRFSNEKFRGYIMRMASILSIILVSLSVPAFADDADLKKQVEQIRNAYVDSFNKQDAAGIAALFATNAIVVGPLGPQPDVVKVAEGTFKAGFNHIDAKVDQVWTLGPDTAIGMGEARLTGKNQSGGPIENANFWTATYVKEGGKWKIRMLSSIPKPPPAK
jgi:ketosteroid isomerase-like protein